MFPHSVDIYEHLLHAEDIAMNKTDMILCLHEPDILAGEITKKQSSKIISDSYKGYEEKQDKGIESEGETG